MQKHPDATVRQQAGDWVELMTPIVKAYFTDLGIESANIGVQVYGGHGYIREHGMEQYIRDARITQLYEGTNGIQALDLVGRKMGQHAGRFLRAFFHPTAAFLEEHKGDAALADFVKPLAKAFGRLQEATTFVAQNGMRDPEEAGAAATEYLRLFALTAVGYMWARMAVVAAGKVEGDESGFYRTKLATGRFYMTRILPQTTALFESIKAGAAPLMALEAEAF